jgi:membrane-bound serine protease (ClpP class)
LPRAREGHTLGVFPIASATPDHPMVTAMLRAHALLAAVAALHAAAAVAWAAEPAPAVLVAEVDAIIHPISSEFMVNVMDRADTAKAAAVVFVLRTPGGLLDATRTIVSRMIVARTPIVMFVAPSGARAASAGFILVLASDVAAMAPGTHIGAAHPVSGSGEKMTDTLEKKAASDVAAYARSLAEARHRNVRLAEEAVTQSRAFTDGEARAAAPPLIDLVATSVDDLVSKLDGRTVARFDGRTVTLQTRGARVERVAMTTRQRLLSAIAHPQVAYILMSLGLLGLTIEMWNPGLVLPGVVGGVSLLLAFFAFQVLPVNEAGFLLIALGVGLLVLELKVPSFGALGIGGACSLVLGSMLLTRDMPEIAIGPGLVLPIALGFSTVFLFLGRLALTAQRRPAVSGAEGMRGAVGLALTAIAPGTPGQIAVHGETWRAVSTHPIAPGDRVEVTAIDGLTLTVHGPQQARRSPDEN